MHDLELSEEQVMIRNMAREFARNEIAGELGLLGMVVPEQWGRHVYRLRGPTHWRSRKFPPPTPPPAR